MRFHQFRNAERNQTLPEALVKINYASAGSHSSMVIEPAAKELDLADWVRLAKSWLQERLYDVGAILLRKFEVQDAAEFDRIVRGIASSGETMDYVENTSPRTTVRGNVKTSTDHRADQEIVLHNEHSFSGVFPSKLFLHCRSEPKTGGETPLADCRRIVKKLPISIRERFERRGGYLYVRNFGSGFGPDWPDVFQTHDQRQLERYLIASDIGFEWRHGGRLRIWYRRPVEVRHPVTGETTWFNHVLFWHVSSLAEPMRDFLTSSFGEHDLPNQSLYGDGSSIEQEVVDDLRQVYAEETWLTPWKANDVLVLDNLLLAHGRRPYTGARLILFAMADPWTHADVKLNGSL